MRGKEEFAKAEGIHIGITPAYAGKRKRFTILHELGQDHPRLCGEKSKKDVIWLIVYGSPPPMRGKENSKTEIIRRGRITPAYAGKSSTTTGCNVYNQDHPRLCGEKDNPASRICTMQGSPPPMRGKGVV